MSINNLHPDLNNPQELWVDKVGYDFKNKRMIARIAYALHEVVTLHNRGKKTWTNVVRYMFNLEGDDVNRIAINGYYGTIRAILKDIKVIKYVGKELRPAENWDRFYSANEDWSWFITNTWGRGRGQIIK